MQVDENKKLLCGEEENEDDSSDIEEVQQAQVVSQVQKEAEELLFTNSEKAINIAMKFKSITNENKVQVILKMLISDIESERYNVSAESNNVRVINSRDCAKNLMLRYAIWKGYNYNEGITIREFLKVTYNDKGGFETRLRKSFQHISTMYNFIIKNPKLLHQIISTHNVHNYPIAAAVCIDTNNMQVN